MPAARSMATSSVALSLESALACSITSRAVCSRILNGLPNGMRFTQP
jgi:hypothetical protein